MPPCVGIWLRDISRVRALIIASSASTSICPLPSDGHSRITIPRRACICIKDSVLDP